ncbi:hypothetical protein D9613_011575 [Agrocybe pediades]|uniref:Uncharacterized protein n=1 Tax=Agrocybe pediades TaxID=84607 RepID=A0A8H4QVL2_9AGAR|nr:hypothetical protein D9613_011575 [Agrocybe pediades]
MEDRCASNNSSNPLPSDTSLSQLLPFRLHPSDEIGMSAAFVVDQDSLPSKFLTRRPVNEELGVVYEPVYPPPDSGCAQVPGAAERGILVGSSSPLGSDRSFPTPMATSPSSASILHIFSPQA